MMTDPAPVVREAEERDVPRVAQIYRHHVAHGLASFETEPPSDEEMTRRYRALIERRYPYLVAEIDGKVVGYAYAGPYRTRPAYGNSVENSVYVDPDCAKRGVGRALLESLIQAATERGYRQMIAVIGDSGNAASIELHRRCGFSDAGVLRSVGFKHGRWLDSVFMQRELGDGDGTLPDV